MCGKCLWSSSWNNFICANYICGFCVVISISCEMTHGGGGGGGGQGQGEQRRGFRTKALMRDLGTRGECRQRVFVRTRTTLWKWINSCPARFEPATLGSIAHDYSTAPLPHHWKNGKQIFILLLSLHVGMAYLCWSLSELMELWLAKIHL